MTRRAGLRDSRCTTCGAWLDRARELDDERLGATFNDVTPPLEMAEPLEPTADGVTEMVLYQFNGTVVANWRQAVSG